MKYIKLFESYNNYFFEIDRDQYDKLLNKKEEFDELLLQKLYKEILDEEWIKSKMDEEFTWNTFGEEFTLEEPVIDERTGKNKVKSIIQVYKLNDEWYLTAMHRSSWISNYYKCDQVDGVIELINNLYNNINESKVERLYKQIPNEAIKLKFLVRLIIYPNKSELSIINYIFSE